ncbi:hypothetical protein SVIOM74S_09200 [Streptomyces violarus]
MIRPEAEAVVHELHRLTQDSDYADRSIGVIIPRHGDLTRLVQNLVDQRIDVSARERHSILVGTPEQFQGDQRDVILLSMVVDGANVIAAALGMDVVLAQHVVGVTRMFLRGQQKLSSQASLLERRVRRCGVRQRVGAAERH